MNRSQEEKTISIATIAIGAALALLGVVMLTAAAVTIPLQQEAVAQQQDNTTATTTQSIMPASSNKTFYVFSVEVEGVNETAARVAGDIYSLPEIVVNRGDSVTVHFYNTEPKEEAVERHSFTIDAQPYRVNIDIAPGESGNATFTADQEGIFPYYCIYHLPSMTGQLVVLPPSSPGASSPPGT